MRRFNPEKELYKIQYGNRNKVLYGIILLLLIISIGSTYALYQVRYSKRIIYTKVAPFSNYDIDLAVYIDGSPSSNGDFPDKDAGKIYEKIDCGKTNVRAYWDYDKWALVLETSKKAKCTVYFKTGTSSSGEKLDTSGANPPELYQGLIPIRYEDTNDDGTPEIIVADPNGNDWYNYDEKRWANAVLIDHTDDAIMNKFYSEGKLNVGREITTDDILQMYVWIPRYKYQLFNVNYWDIPEQMINIKFENGIETTGEAKCNIDAKGKETCTNALNGNWYTHPAFTFGETELPGIWIGKFEPSDSTNPTGNAKNVIGEITILPNKVSMVMKSVKTIYNAEKEMEKENNKYNLKFGEIDAHMMKNMEWGAVAYLSNSKYGIYTSDGEGCAIVGMNKENCEIWKNNSLYGAKSNNYGTYTGCVGSSMDAATIYSICDTDKRWNSQNGVKASTTGSIYGVYDMAGGAHEITMGVITNSSGTEPYYAGSEYTKDDMIDSKYYDLYEYGTASNDHRRGHLGDATREVLKNYGNRLGGWNNDIADMPNGGSSDITPWSSRGGSAGYVDGYAGIFMFGVTHGGEYRLWQAFSFRSVLTHA